MTAISRPATEFKPVFQPLTPERMDDLGTVLRGNFGAGCWCMFPRLTDAQTRQLPGEGTLSPRKREAMTRLAARDRSPGLLAYAGNEPIGWIAVAPRDELTRLTRSRATPPADDTPVWVIPCITVRKGYRGQGIAVALIQAAVTYAGTQGAPAVEAYPRAGRRAHRRRQRLFRHRAAIPPRRVPSNPPAAGRPPPPLAAQGSNAHRHAGGRRVARVKRFASVQ